LGSFSLKFFDLVLEFSALSLVIFKLLFFSDLDFFQIKTKVIWDSVELSQDFVFGHDVFHVFGKFVVFLSEFVKLIVGDHDLLTDLLCVNKEGRVLVFFGHFSQSCRELSNDGVFVLIFFGEFLIHELLSLQLISEFSELFGGIEVFFLEFGFHGFNVFIDNFVNVFDLFSGDEELSVIFVTFLKNRRKYTAAI
jgi:hypothetical protein